MPVTLQNSSGSREAPVDPETLQKLLEDELAQTAETNAVIANVASALQKKSTKHKFIVLLTEVKTDEDLNENVSIKLSVAAVWDGERDGYHHFRAGSASTYMVTVYWIYLG